MSNRDKFIAWLDAAANLTGIPQFEQRLQGDRHRRHLRWLPIVALALATGGILLAGARPRSYWLGYSLLMLGFAIANFMPVFGPLKPWGGLANVDERDRSVRRDAYLFAFAVISGVAIIGQCALILAAVEANWPIETLLKLMGASALYLMTLFSTVPTLHASWATRPVDEE